MEFEWTNGRVLSQITVNPTDPNGTADVYSYTYDESGIRSSKTVNGTTTYFTTKDGVILSQTDGTNTMYFQYDNSGNPTGFIYNGTQYFYLTNQMGDVIGIADATGALIATYTYGAWGEVLAVTPATSGSTTQSAIANANPLRYRGYYQDQETGYYYLQSRYYCPKESRFVNADILEIASVEKSEIAGNCLFAYCENGPINGSDKNGTRILKRYISRSTAITIMSVIMSVVAPALAAKIKASTYASKLVLGTLRRLMPKNAVQIARSGSLISRHAKILYQVYSKYKTLTNKLIYGVVPAVKKASYNLTIIRKVIWRATGRAIKSITNYSITRSIQAVVAILQRPKSIRDFGQIMKNLDLVFQLLSFTGWIALFLDGATDGLVNDRIKLW